MADEDVQVTGEKVGQIQTQQQQTPSTPTVYLSESFAASTVDPELHTCVARTEDNRSAHDKVFKRVCVCLCTSVCVCVYIPALSSLAWISH